MVSIKFIAGLLVGMGVMYLLDPGSGQSRRAHVREQTVKGGKKGWEKTRGQAGQAWSSSQGRYKEWRSARKEGKVHDQALQAEALQTQDLQAQFEPEAAA